MKTIINLIIFSLLILVSKGTIAEPAVIAPKADKSLLLDIVKVSEQRYITVGERGHILISENSGNDWRQVAVPVDVNLTAIDFLDESHGVAVGFDQTILLTDDSGETWTVSHQEVSNFQPALFSVLYTEENNITAVGSYGLYLETNDGGKTWNNRQVDSLSDVYDGFSHFYDIERLSENVWYLSGEKYIAEANDLGEEFSKGMVAVTQNGGKTWEKLPSPYEGSFFGINVHNSDIYVYGLRGNLFHSDDMGQSWEKIALGDQAGLHDMTILDDGSYILVGTGGAFIRRDGNDITIAKRTDLKGRAALVRTSEGAFIIVGEGGVETYSLNSNKKDSVKGQ